MARMLPLCRDQGQSKNHLVAKTSLMCKTTSSTVYDDTGRSTCPPVHDEFFKAFAYSSIAGNKRWGEKAWVHNYSSATCTSNTCEGVLFCETKNIALGGCINGR